MAAAVLVEILEKDSREEGDVVKAEEKVEGEQLWRLLVSTVTGSGRGERGSDKCQGEDETMAIGALQGVTAWLGAEQFLSVTRS